MTVLAVVTGASGGIGSAVAEQLSAIVDDLLLCSRRIDPLVELRPSGDARVRRIAADVTSAGDVAVVVEAVRDLDPTRIVLVNAAGSFGPVSTIEDADIDGWEQTLRVHVVGALRTMSHLMSLMIAAGWGRIINVSSAQSLHGPDPAAGAYATAKGAMNVMTAGAAMQVAGTGVSVCAIHPGDVDTAMAGDIRAKAAAAGERAGALAEWAGRIGAGMGDGPEGAGALVAEIIARPASWSNGRFLLVESSRDRHPSEGWSMPVGSAET